MTLIKCIECGKEISDKSECCPNCGCPTIESIKINNHEYDCRKIEYKCKNCNNNEYIKVEDQGGVFLICKKCGYVDELVPRKQEKQESKPKCPTCGSTNIGRAGFFSIKPWAQFKCKSCGYEW